MAGEDFLFNFISNVGFPIAMCVYFVVKTEKAINNNTKALQEVKQVMSVCQRKP